MNLGPARETVRLELPASRASRVGGLRTQGRFLTRGQSNECTPLGCAWLARPQELAGPGRRAAELERPHC
jgi:hypothetical protein